jgi:glucose-6-phosphate 1-dehydrogenase
MVEESDALVFFGATGDLAYKKIFPALASMLRHGKLKVPVVGVAKAGWNLEQLQARAKASLEAHGGCADGTCEKLCGMLRYIDGDYREAGTFAELRRQLGEAKRPIYYLAIPPSMFATVAQGLAGAACVKGARIVVEKPFGRDLASALALDATIRKFFEERAIFRIDHFLGKEPVQNLLYSRFANLMFEPFWNRNNIASVQITMGEKFDVQGRGKFYEEAGAIRDVLQNHLLQMVAQLAMEPPAAATGEPLRDERAKLLRLVRTLTPADVVRGQYQGYLEEADVAPESPVETYVAVRLWIDSWRWAGVPFYIRTGKCLPMTCTEILVQLRRPPQEVFGEKDRGSGNYLRFRMSPEVVIALGIRSKRAGEAMVGQDVELVMQHQPHDELEPYERLLGEAMRGEATYFAREDGVEEAWRIVNPVLGARTGLYEYEKGTWGPKESAGLIAANGGWHGPEERGVRG